jgi:4-hydroxy-tetrahydrodipicolinate reductase
MATRIVVSGACGRMGQTVVRLAREAGDFEILGGIDREASTNEHDLPRIDTIATAADLVRQADVVIDFSTSDATAALIRERAGELRGKAIVIGTTGLGAETEHALDALAKDSAVLLAANFSIGVNLMLGLVEAAARVLAPDRFDVEIVEAHHRHKADAPSGTALALGRAVAQARGVRLDDVRKDGRTGKSGARPTGEIGFHALRGGGVAGDHEVAFIGALETLAISHHAVDRSIFADGAIQAARWMAGKAAGRYTMKDVLGI